MYTFKRTIDQNYQNNINKSIIFNYIRENQPVSRVKVSKDLKISASAVTRIIGNLIDSGYVLESGKEVTKVGKRPISLKINGKKGCFIALDLSQDNLRISINDFSGKILETYELFEISDSGEIVAKLISELNKILKFDKNLKIYKYKDIKLNAISIGVPANIDIDTGRITSASLYKNWYSINFKEILEKKYNLPVYMEKDVFLSVLAEKYFGEGKGFKDIIFIEISSGVGSGIIINNEVLRGVNNSAGEITFLNLYNDYNNHNNNGKGFLDKFASYQSFKEQMIDMLKEGKNSSIKEIVKNDLSKIDTQMIFRSALEGDELSLDIIKSKADLLGRVIANLILTIDPQIVILGGNISNCEGVEVLLIDKIIEKIKKNIPFELPQIKTSLLKNNIVLIGASLFAIEKTITGKFPYKI